MNTTANDRYKPLAAGDYVVVGPGEEYAGLVGRVTEIIKLGSPEHETGNPADDVIVDLSVTPYSDYEKGEILALIKELGYEADSYDDVSIDCVIIAPDDLTRITTREYEQYNTELTASLQSALEIGERLSYEHYGDMRKTLTDRVELNYKDYEADWLKLGNRELLDMAPWIHAVSDAYSYMTLYHSFSEDELRFYLQFQNPLDLTAEQWHKQRIDLGDMSYTMDSIIEPERQQSALECCALADDKPGEQQSLKDQLIDKLWKEYGEFLDTLEKKPVQVIIDSSYEKVFKEDLVLTVEYRNFADAEITALLAQDNLLDVMYSEWLDTDVSYMDLLSDCIAGTTDMLVKDFNAEQTAPPPVKPQTAREPSLLDEVREAAREIEAQKSKQQIKPSKKHDRGID